MNILNEVYKIIESRAKNPEEGSYTNSLLTKGLDKILKKVGEESAETIIAAKNENKNELNGEIADLLYHILVMMYVKGVSCADVESVLQERFTKGGFHGRNK
jgi:phosphoribosyl-ATP pyrophosphohydrolase/phosphoribosyl-AMP cyclohydrolase